MAKNYAILRFKALKTPQALTAAYRHNFRETIAENVDPSRIGLDREIVKLQDSDYNAAFKRRVAEEGVKNIRKNHTKAIETILTFSNKLSEENFSVNKWADMNVEWLKKTFGEENVVSVVLHEDETAPHLHAIIVPIKDGEMAATRLLESTEEQVKAHNGMKGYAYMQDKYAEYMSELGLHRGITSSPAKYTEPKEYYKYANDKLPEPSPKETVNEYFERANKVHQKKMLENFRAIREQEEKVNQLKSEVNKASEKIEELEEKNGELAKKTITEQQAKRDEMMRHVLTALRNNYPDAESRSANFSFLAELDRAGRLFEKGYNREEVEANVDKSVEEIDQMEEK